MPHYLSLQEFHGAFGDAPLRLPDLTVESSTREDWRLVADALDGLGLESEAIRNFALPSGELDSVAVFPANNTQLNFFPGPEVTFDVDLKELETQETVDVLLGVVRSISQSTNKNVLSTPEGESGAVLRYSLRDDSFHVVSR